MGRGAETKAVEGDGPPMAVLVATCFSPLVRYFRRRGYAPDAAEDATQEVFTRMLGLEGHAHIEKPEAYLFRVARTVMTDRARRESVRHGALHQNLDDLSIAGEEPSAERVLSDRQQLERLRAILDEMPARRREMLMLNRMDGLSYSQLAARYGVTVSAIEKQMMKAIAHLHRRMGDR